MGSLRLACVRLCMPLARQAPLPTIFVESPHPTLTIHPTPPHNQPHGGQVQRRRAHRERRHLPHERRGLQRSVRRLSSFFFLSLVCMLRPSIGFCLFPPLVCMCTQCIFMFFVCYTCQCIRPPCCLSHWLSSNKYTDPTTQSPFPSNINTTTTTPPIQPPNPLFSHHKHNNHHHQTSQPSPGGGRKCTRREKKRRPQRR